MRLRTLPIASIAIISILAAGSTVAAAATDTASTARVSHASIAPVNLGAAGGFAILTKSGVTDVHASAIKGNVGASLEIS
jgi:hypothetical protein